jgi:hypothetical protein
MNNYTNETNIMEENEEYNKEITAWRWDLLHHISNACAITGLVAFANLLIPVSKNSPLVELLGWTPQEALLCTNTLVTWLSLESPCMDLVT